MSHQASRWSHAGFHFSLLVLILILLTPVCKAQIGGIQSDPLGNVAGKGPHRIEGRIYYPSGRQFDRAVKVRLRGTTKGQLFTTSDTNGVFVFSGLPVGDYELTIDLKPEFQPVNESVLILRDTISENAHVVMVEIRLRLNDKAETRSSGTIDASIPQQARELYEKALQSAKASDHKKAVEQLEKALAIHPQFVLGLNELGVQYLMLGQLDQAAEQFVAGLKLAPEAAVLHLNYGILLVRQKRYADAVVELRKAVSETDSAAAYLHLGRALIGLNDYEQALAALQKAIKLGGKEVSEAHRYLGAIHIELGQKELAIKELTEYLRLVPTAKDGRQIQDMIKSLRESPTKQ